jgi:hypothetical protein
LAERAHRRKHADYAGFVDEVVARLAAFERVAPGADAVARTIYRAATDRWPRLRYPVGSRAALLPRRVIPTPLYVRVVRRVLNAW